jgi:hypothetical protein
MHTRESETDLLLGRGGLGVQRDPLGVFSGMVMLVVVVVVVMVVVAAAPPLALRHSACCCSCY